jgi:cob(I)alamin adenosyltransferase
MLCNKREDRQERLAALDNSLEQRQQRLQCREFLRPVDAPSAAQLSVCRCQSRRHYHVRSVTGVA